MLRPRVGKSKHSLHLPLLKRRTEGATGLVGRKSAAVIRELPLHTSKPTQQTRTRVCTDFVILLDCAGLAGECTLRLQSLRGDRKGYCAVVDGTHKKKQSEGFLESAFGRNRGVTRAVWRSFQVSCLD